MFVDNLLCARHSVKYFAHDCKKKKKGNPYSRKEVSREMVEIDK